MKLTTLMLIVAIMQVSASSYAQKITLSETDAPLNKVFEQIRVQTGYDFLVTRAQLKKARPVTIHVQNEQLSDVLTEIFREQPLDYKIQEQAVIVVRKTIPLPPIQVVKALARAPLNGKVSDIKGTGIPGVSVYDRTTGKGVSTDGHGEFTLDTHEGDILVISAIGYTKQEVTVGNSPQLNIVLKEQMSDLSEVVVVGYKTQKRANVTGSLVTLQSKDIENSAFTNPFQTLEGKTPGLRVSQTSGQPGAEGMTLNIRGPNSFASNNDPLVIINGVVGSMTDLDPSFIESITVLKDAASASIYGARAANGVILVTTKTGANQDGFRVTFNSNYVNQSRINQPKRVWNSVQYMNMFNTAVDNAGGGDPKYDQAIIDLYQTPSKKYPSFNWEDFMIQPIGIYNNNVSIGGKSGNTNFQASLGAWNQDGIIKGFDYQKYSGLFSLESQLSKKFKVGYTMNGLVDNQDAPYNGVQDVLLAVIAQRPDYEPTLSDGSGNFTHRAYPFEYPSKNPYAIASNGGQNTNRFIFNATAYTRYNILDNLTWEVKGGMRSTQEGIKLQAPAVSVYNYTTNQPSGYLDDHSTIELTETNNIQRYYTIYSTLDYTKSFFKDFNFDALVGVSREKSTLTSLSGYRRGFASPLLDVLSAGPTDGQTNMGTKYEYSLASLFGRVNVNYLQKYLLEADFRRDGSSRFPPANKYGVFPSFSVGWQIAKEHFIADHISWLDELKLRASYGQLGNDNLNGYYPYQSTVSPGLNYPFSNLQGGVGLTSLTDPRLKWEQTTIKNIGIDFNIKNSLLYGSVDYFTKTTSGILRQEQIPGYAGVASPFVNQGIVNNKGFEIAIGHKGHIGEFIYGADFNIAAYKNKVTKFGAPEYGRLSVMQEGSPINSYYMYQGDGIYQSQQEISQGPTPLYTESPGDVRLKDVNGDGAITPADRVVVNGISPDYYYGLNLFAKYKGFDIAVLLQGDQGRKVLINNNDNLILPFTHNTVPLTYWENAWTPQNHSTTIPLMTYYNGPLGASTKAPSTFWLKDASYSRLKNVTLGYTFPGTMTKKIGIRQLRVFVSGENLLTFTKFKFGDPESVWNKNNGDPTADALSSYPMLRSITGGLSVQF